MTMVTHGKGRKAVKGEKAVSKILTSCYTEVLSTSLSRSVQGDKAKTAVVIDGLFTLPMLPFSSHRLLLDVVLFFIARWIKPMFALADHVHLVWDRTSRHGGSPEDIERRRLDVTKQSFNCDQAASDLTLT